jgi:exonuclease III
MEARSINMMQSPPGGEASPVRDPPTREHEPRVARASISRRSSIIDDLGHGPGERPDKEGGQPDDDGLEPVDDEQEVPNSERQRERVFLPGEGDFDEGEGDLDHRSQGIPEDAGSEHGSGQAQTDDEEEDVNQEDDIDWGYEADEDLIFEDITGEYADQEEENRRNACAKNTKAAIKLASLNMKGRGETRNIGIDSKKNKWFHVNQMMREQKIGILALQETHMTEELKDSIETTFKRLLILSCSDPESPNSKGVAIVLNRDITNCENVKCTSIIPGRAMAVSIPWHARDVLNILAIYAPNEPTENRDFWIDLKRRQENNEFPKANVMLGDFNIVEDSLDRLPSHGDRAQAVRALRELKHSLGLIDGWRSLNRDTKAYTFTSESNGAHSRIDRIYTTPDIVKSSANWRIDTPGAFDTDHRMVSAQIIHEKIPFIGKGRFAIPAQMCKDKPYMRKVQALADDLERDCMEAGERPNDSPYKTRQQLLKIFIDRIVELAKERGKERAPRLDKQIKELERELRETVNDSWMLQAEKAEKATEITEKIAKIAGERHSITRTAAAARNHLEGEVISKYWSGINANRKPRDIITKLRNPTYGQEGVKEFADTSKEMADVTKEYHESLQDVDIDEEETEEVRTDVFEPVLRAVDRRLEQADKSEMAKFITTDLVSQAIRESANGKAAGMSGVPSEIWKHLNVMFEITKDSERPMCNIAKVLTLTYRDIEKFGVQEGTDISLGWLCPIFKKKDKYCVENYRPITVLNSEYKIFTKALSIRLSKIVGSVIHEDQAGFIKGRSIFNQVKLAKMIIPFAERAGVRGALVALDQEKAYDKIAHDYLWAVLGRFNFPEHFIKTIRALYTGAQTLAIINGVQSERYTVKRGVRQGDPLSCLLFDLAIEPLACMIRSSQLNGIKINGCNERVLASLFADDTSVVLGEGDKYEDLISILLTWTKASKGRFNIPKTVIIPIGPPEYRQKVMEERKLKDGHDTIPADIHIAADGEPVRLLGAWIGNKVNNADPWGPVLEKVEKHLNRWEKGHPTMEGRRLIIQMIVAGMTQYLTKVQGMPEDIEKELAKRIQNYVWDGRIPTVNAAVMRGPLLDGGKKILDIKARNEAIQLTWLQTYLSPRESRPKWAYVADEIIKRNIPKAKANMDAKATSNCFLQSWDPKIRTGMPDELIEMMKVANKYDVALEALMVDEPVMRQMPLWYHIGANDTLSYHNNKPMAKCLRDNHDVRTVGDAMDLIQRRPARHRNRRLCPCNVCQESRRRKCEYPHHCMEYCRTLVATLKAKWNPLAVKQNDGLDIEIDQEEEMMEDAENEHQVQFNPDVRLKEYPEKGIRAFTRREKRTHLPAYRQKGRGPHNSVVVTVAGTVTGTKTDNIRYGAGAFFDSDDNTNIHMRVSGDKARGTDRAIIAMIGKLARSIDLNTELTVRIGSKRVHKMLTSRLEKLEDRGFVDIPEGEAMQSSLAALRRRGSALWLRLIADPGSDIPHREAQRLASRGCQEVTEDKDELKLEPRFARTGIRLEIGSQNLFYKLILSRKKGAPRRQTTMQIDIARWGVHEITGELPSEEKIWKTSRDRTFLKAERTFLFNLMHNSYKVGQYWQKIRNYEQRGECRECDACETLEHVLTECTESGQETVWRLAKRLYEMKTKQMWPGNSYGTLMGSCATDVGGAEKGAQGLNRFYRILMVTSMQFIWAIRCERRIPRGNDPPEKHTEDEIHNRWVAKMNHRLSIDQMLTSEGRFDKKAIPVQMVLDTWKGTLADENTLPSNWTRSNGVLVGIRSRRPPGRNR